MKEQSLESLNKYLFSENERLNATIDDLEEKIDKAIEYIKEKYKESGILQYLALTKEEVEELLEILGDKENE